MNVTHKCFFTLYWIRLRNDAGHQINISKIDSSNSSSYNGKNVYIIVFHFMKQRSNKKKYWCARNAFRKFHFYVDFRYNIFCEFFFSCSAVTAFVIQFLIWLYLFYSCWKMVHRVMRICGTVSVVILLRKQFFCSESRIIDERRKITIMTRIMTESILKNL